MTKLTNAERKTLTTRVACCNDELLTCTTDAMRRCVIETRDQAQAVLDRNHW